MRMVLTLILVAVGRDAKSGGHTLGMVTHYWHSNNLMHGQLLDGCGFLRKTYNIQKNMSETYMYKSATTSTRILYI
jgi:hypothetical protein